MAATKSQPSGEGLAPDLGVVFSQSTPITIADNPSRTQGLPSRAALARRWPEVEPAQVRRVAQRIHACGQRAAYEFIADLARGRDFAETLADFGRLDPAIYVAVVALVCDGGHA